MEVKNKSAGILCNFEVLDFLNEQKSQPLSTPQANSQLATILYETSHYLQDSSSGVHSIANVRNIMKALQNFPVPLTRTEKLMIVNNPPTSSLQLSLIVRDCDERLSEDQTQDLLSIISKHLLQT